MRIASSYFCTSSQNLIAQIHVPLSTGSSRDECKGAGKGWARVNGKTVKYNQSDNKISALESIVQDENRRSEIV